MKRIYILPFPPNPGASCIVCDKVIGLCGGFRRCTRGTSERTRAIICFSTCVSVAGSSERLQEVFTLKEFLCCRAFIQMSPPHTCTIARSLALSFRNNKSSVFRKLSVRNRLCGWCLCSVSSSTSISKQYTRAWVV